MSPPCNYVGIVQIIGVTKILQTNEYAFVMPYCQSSLQHLYRNKTYKIKWTKLIESLRYLALDLKQIHDKGLIHRNLHSGNILLDKDNDPLISDFGLCKP